MNDEPKETPSVSPADFLRIPGLFRRWEWKRSSQKRRIAIIASAGERGIRP